MTWYQRFRSWRTERLIRQLVDASVAAMLVFAAQRLGHELSAAERAELPKIYGAWICENDRVLGLVAERPTRVIHLFLSELIP